MLKKRMGLIGAAAGLAAGLLSALQMIDRVRLVDIVTLFAGGMGAGAGLVKAVIDYRKAQDRKLPSPPTAPQVRKQSQTDV
jgi:hypothetical protein